MDVHFCEHFTVCILLHSIPAKYNLKWENVWIHTKIRRISKIWHIVNYKPGASAAEPPETQGKLLLRRKIFFAMSLMTKLTLTLTMMRKWYSVSRSSIDENNESVSRSWIV